MEVEIAMKTGSYRDPAVVKPVDFADIASKIS